MSTSHEEKPEIPILDRIIKFIIAWVTGWALLFVCLLLIIGMCLVGSMAVGALFWYVASIQQ